MYRLANYSSVEESFHFFVSNLIHRGGWTFIDGRFSSSPVTSWPLPGSATAPGNVDVGDYVVVQSSDADLSTNRDQVKITLATATTVTIEYMRRGLGTLPVWDPVGHAMYDPLDTQILEIGDPAGSPYTPVLDYSAPADRNFIYTSSTVFVLAHFDSGTSTVVDAVWSGFLETLILSEDTPSPTLGVGEDPYPLGVLDLDPAVASGQTFDESNTPEELRFVVEFNTLTPSELHANPISWSGAVDRQLLTQYVAVEEPSGGGSAFGRGVVPGVYKTSSLTSLQVLRLPATGQEFLTISAGLAIGPLA